jgi:hypothetical protein
MTACGIPARDRSDVIAIAFQIWRAALTLRRPFYFRLLIKSAGSMFNAIEQT